MIIGMKDDSIWGNMGKQLNIEIPEELHWKLKRKAAETQLSLKSYLMTILLEHMQHEKERELNDMA